MSGETLASRGSVHYARNTPQDLGYTTERIIGSSRHFDLIAWKKDKDSLLFLVIRIARVPGITRFSDEILKLSLMVHRHEIPGELQIHRFSTDSGPSNAKNVITTSNLADPRNFKRSYILRWTRLAYTRKLLFF
jgi:hypothetical protein